MPQQAAFSMLVRGTNDELGRLLGKFHAGTVTADELGEELYDALRRGHAQAYVLGARQSGSKLDPEALRDLAESHGRAAADAENEWLDGFLNDLDSGRYTDDEGNVRLDAINARARMYGHKMRATGNQAFVDQSPADATFTWTMSGIEAHCADCPRLAALSPYNAAELFTTPGAGDTECLTGCKCHLVRDDGVSGLKRPDLAKNNYALSA